MMYRGRPVFEWGFDWGRDVNGRIEWEAREISIGFGAPGYHADQEEVIRGWRGTIWLDGLDEIEAYDDFLVSVSGRLVGFWFPTPQAAFEIVAGVDATHCDIAGEGFHATFGDSPAVYVWLTKTGQTARGAKVTATALNGDGTTRVTFEESVTVDETWQAWGLAYVRFAEDQDEAEAVSEQQQLRTVAVTELPSEYTAVETGQKPVWLYQIKVGEGDSVARWYWTSFAWQVTSNNQAYESVRISHGAIRYDTTGVTQGVTIEVDREIEGSPFKLLLPPYLCQPVVVTIARADFDDLDTVTTVFTGEVERVEINGRVLKVRLASRITSASVPAFLFGPRCPYRLFEPDTCKLDKDLWKQTVTVAALMTDRAVSVSGAGLAGAEANRFREGVFEAGTGANREVRLILQSTAEAGGSVTLTLNAPLRYSAETTQAVITPGCDGLMATCNSKFNNLANFGGHRFALRNLSVKAIEVAAPTGGKK